MGRLAGKAAVLQRNLHFNPALRGLPGHILTVGDDRIGLRVEKARFVCGIDLDRGVLASAELAVIPVTECNIDNRAVIVSDLHRIILRLVGKSLLRNHSAIVLQMQTQFARPLRKRSSESHNAS